MSDYEYDSGNESSNEEDDDDLLALEPENNPADEDSLDYDDYPHSVFNCDQIIEEMVASICEVNTVVQLPQTITRILLAHFKWDKEKLYEHYYAGDQEQLFCDARIVNPNKSVVAVAQSTSGVSSSSSTSSSSFISQKSVRSGHEFCVICCTEFQTNSMTGIACGHRFCKDCWTHYLTTKIMEEGQGQTISCAAHGCDILVDDQTVFNLITDSVKLRYQQLITNSYVECNRLLRWCPKAECSRVIRVEYVDFRPVKCMCNSVFCFLCGENWHEPIKCDLLRRWKKKCDDDSETSNWIAANTKECPRCQVTIEKDGGCNHMICKNQSCQFHFCWVCLGPWAPHGSSWYSCNRFDEDEAKAARDAQEKSRSALQRYLFYCNRYINAMQSLKFENKLYELVKAKMEEMQHHNMSWIEVQFLKKAVDILCQCRQTLMYTYVFAYYLIKNNQSIIFEDNQKDLESATEKLSEYLERDITQDNISAIKQKVQDKSRYCESRRRVLLSHVKEGYDKDLWEYIA